MSRATPPELPAGVPPLPSEITLADGRAYVLPHDGIWPVGRTRVNTRLLDQPHGERRKSVFHPSLAHLARLWLAGLLGEWKAATVAHTLSQLGKFERWLHKTGEWTERTFRVEHITPDLLQALRESDLDLRGSLRRFYEWGCQTDRRYPGFDPTTCAGFDGEIWTPYSIPGLPDLPRSVRRPDGALYVLPDNGVWTVDGERIHTERLDRTSIGGRGRPGSNLRDSLLHPSLAHLIRLWLADELGRVGGGSVYQSLSAFTRFERWLYDVEQWTGGARSFRLDHIGPALFSAFRVYLLEKFDSWGPSLYIRTFYAWGCDPSRMYPGFDAAVLDQLDTVPRERYSSVKAWEPYAVSGLPSLPRQIRLPDGSTYELPNDGVWKPREHKRAVNTRLLDLPTAGRASGSYDLREVRDSVFDRALSHTMRLYLAYRLSRVKVDTVNGDLYALYTLESWLYDSKVEARSFSAANLSRVVLDRFRVWANENAGMKGQTALKVVQFYDWACREGLPDFARVETAAVKGAEFAQVPSGVKTRFNDPEEGAFCYEEYVQITDAVLDAVGGSKLAAHRAAVELCRWFGLRPEAIALMRRRALWIDEDELGELRYMIRIPRVKRAAGSQGESYDEELEESVYELLRSLYPEDDTDLEQPLVPTPRGGTPTAGTYNRMMKTWAKAAGLVTTRVPTTAEEAARNPGGPFAPTPLRMSPYRFRRTMATMMAEQGATAEEIAEALDDDTLEMALVYTANTSNMVETLSRTLDKHPEWIRILRMFKGQVAAKSDEDLPVVLGGVPYFRSYPRYADTGPIGGCAHPGECEWVPPLHCYVCPSFRAVDRAEPHERQLQQLRDEARDAHGRESERVRGVVRRVDAALVQLTYYLRQGGLPPTSPKAKARAKIKQGQRITRTSRGEE